MRVFRLAQVKRRGILGRGQQRAAGGGVEQPGTQCVKRGQVFATQ